jgi:FAD/FMN-containing dehydrogenase
MQSARPYFPFDAINWPAVHQALAGLDCRSSAAELARAGADYHWYSPRLSEQLQGKQPELVVRPRDVAEVLLLARVCATHRVPLTVRGGGTGNYGQCVPLFGGITLDVTALNQVLHIEDGCAVVQAGALMFDVNQALRESGQQLRMWPSTERIATLGGFIAGGHSGIGSMRHGILADPGNVRRLRVVTLEDPPRVVDLLGADIQKVHHAYGSNGVIVEVEVALTPWLEWLHCITVFDSYDDVLRFGLAVGQTPRLDVFQLSAVERRITPFYDGLQDKLQGLDAMFAQVAPGSVPAFEALAQQMGGRLVVRGTAAELHAQGLPSATECAYNHTTLMALQKDRSVTYLQVAYPGPLDAALVARQMQRFGDEVLMHHEFSRAHGELVAFALPLVLYFDEAQLDGLRRSFEADGCVIFDPHTWVLEDGGMKQVDQAQLDFKKQADPLGLMNPGKVRAWDELVLGIPGGQL